MNIHILIDPFKDGVIVWRVLIPEMLCFHEQICTICKVVTLIKFSHIAWYMTFRRKTYYMWVELNEAINQNAHAKIIKLFMCRGDQLW